MEASIDRSGSDWQADHTVSFEVFPEKQSPFHAFIKEQRLYSFGQLAAVYHDSGDYAVSFDKVTLIDRTEEVEDELNRAIVDTHFDAETIFDHILGGLHLSYLDHHSINFQNHVIEAPDGRYEPGMDDITVDWESMQLVNTDSNTVITPERLLTNDEGLADDVKKRVEHIKSYFKSVVENAYTGVSHKHYVYFLLEAFPGQIQVRQLPAMYTELEPYKREARRLEDSDESAWYDLAESLEDEIEGLSRPLFADEKILACQIYQRTFTEHFVSKAVQFLNENPALADRDPGLAMKVIDTEAVLNGETQRYNTLPDKEQRGIEPVEEYLLRSI